MEEIIEVKKTCMEVLQEIEKKWKESEQYHNFCNNRTLRFLEDSITDILNNIITDKEKKDSFEVICEHKNGSLSNYINCSICIEYGDGNYTSFNIDEMLGNCSTVSIHHFNGNNVCKRERGEYEEPYLFEKYEQFVEFISSIEMFLYSITHYSNIFFSISSESPSCFAKYCEEKATLIDEFKNERNAHNIKYYSRRLNKNYDKGEGNN